MLHILCCPRLLNIMLFFLVVPFCFLFVWCLLRYPQAQWLFFFPLAMFFSIIRKSNNVSSFPLQVFFICILLFFPRIYISVFIFCLSIITCYFIKYSVQSRVSFIFSGQIIMTLYWSDPYSVFQIVFLPFSMTCNFFLSQSTIMNRLLVMWLWVLDGNTV